jgi:3-oxoacyl-[acyl-carrier-protein] synthase III
MLSQSVVVPPQRLSIESVFASERALVDSQLSELTVGFRERLVTQLGIEAVAEFGDVTSTQAGFDAASRALREANVEASNVAFVLDYSTFASDRDSIWSLAHAVQFHIGAPGALALGIHGSGCAGLHAALLVASAMLQTCAPEKVALLVAADRAPSNGRSCLPISVMADAASAAVVALSNSAQPAIGRVRSVAMHQEGRFADVLVAQNHPPRMRIDAKTFESKLLPLHYVMLHRMLVRALRTAQMQRGDLEAVVYPNTSELDRSGVVRALGLAPSALVGPGPQQTGHAFANDMLINAGSWFNATPSVARSVWLAAGSGFTWAAAVVEHGSSHASG